MVTQAISNIIKYIKPIIQTISRPSRHRTAIFTLLFTLCALSYVALFIFNYGQRRWFLSQPRQMVEHFAQVLYEHGESTLYTQYRDKNLGYDPVSPLEEHDFPIINLQLDPLKPPTFPAPFHTIQQDEIDPQISPIDLKHRHLLPTDVIEIEKPLHGIRLWNPAPIAIPYNPLGYRYLMTRRIVKYKGLDFERYSFEGWWLDGAGSQLTCFSDWFPYDLIKEQDDEHRELLKEWNAESDHDFIYENKRQYGPKHPTIMVDDDIDPFLRVVINTTRIDKEKLAKYYGYESYDQMPYHPRVPTKTTNTTWSHRCITPWRGDDEEVLQQHHWGHGLQGPEDMRMTYDRCGRLLVHYGAHNDYSPFYPDWGMRVVDARMFERGEMLWRGLSDLCPLRHTYQEPIHLLGNGVEGHQPWSTKNWILYNYGHSLRELNEMVKLKLEFTKAASLYDYRTNSLYLTPNNYRELLLKLHPPTPELLPPWRSLDRPIQIKTAQSIIKPSSTIDYLAETSTYITRWAPLSTISGAVEKFEKPRKDIYLLNECLREFNFFRHEFEVDYVAKAIHATANLLLIYISPEDWEQDPFFSLTPKKKRTNWVYFGLANDRSHKSERYPMYRPFAVMLDATTGDVIAVRPFTATLPGKCREEQFDDSCKYGVGTNCHELCAFIYVHYLTVVDTPLTYSLLSNEDTWTTNTTSITKKLTIPPNPPTTVHPHFNPYSYDRRYANDLHLTPEQQTPNYTQEATDWLNTIINTKPKPIELEPLVPSHIPPNSTVTDFVNPKFQPTILTPVRPTPPQSRQTKPPNHKSRRPTTTTTTTSPTTRSPTTPPTTTSPTTPTTTTPTTPINDPTITTATSTTFPTTPGPTSLRPSSNKVLQGLHFTLPTYHTLDSQVFAVFNSMDNTAYFQEFDLRAFWRQRHPCNIPLDTKTYPKSIPISPAPKIHDDPIQTKLKKRDYQPKTHKAHVWVPKDQQFDVYDWDSLDDPPIRNVPYGLPQATDLLSGWHKYVNVEEYQKRADFFYSYYVVPIFLILTSVTIVLLLVEQFCYDPSLLRGNSSSTLQHTEYASVHPDEYLDETDRLLSDQSQPVFDDESAESSN